MKKVNNTTYDVKRTSEGWIVKSGEVVNHKLVYPSQKEAILSAESKAKETNGMVIVHSMSGRIRARFCFTGEPLPPKSLRQIQFPQDLNQTDKIKIGKIVNEFKVSQKAKKRPQEVN